MVPDINEKDIDAVATVLRSGMLVQGKEVAKLENTVAALSATSCGVAVSNGTASLHLALLAAGIGAGDEVIIPSFSYIATANVVEIAGATPVFIDINADTFNIDVSKIEAAVTSKTKAILPVHEFGLACDITQIMQLALKHKLIVIEDAACALGAEENGKPVGGFGDIGSFSLHPRKNVTSGEGGVIVTNNNIFSDKMKMLRNHGIDPSATDMDFIAPGYNYRLTDFQAALVNSQLERFEQIIVSKQKLADVYFNELLHPLIQLPFVPKEKKHTWQTFHLLLHESVNRNILIEELKKKGVGANYGAQCIPDQSFYCKKYKHNSRTEFPNAFKAYHQGLAIPLYSKLSTDDIYHISKIILQTIERCWKTKKYS